MQLKGDAIAIEEREREKKEDKQITVCKCSLTGWEWGREGEEENWSEREKRESGGGHIPLIAPSHNGLFWKS